MDRVFLRRAIVPIGIMFSLSLIGGNLAYLYLSVSFIQMLKVSLASIDDGTFLSNRISTRLQTPSLLSLRLGRSELPPQT